MFDLEMWINKRLHKKCGDGGDGIRRSRQEATELMLLDMCMRTHQIICDLIFFYVEYTSEKEESGLL